MTGCSTRSAVCSDPWPRGRGRGHRRGALRAAALAAALLAACTRPTAVPANRPAPAVPPDTFLPQPYAYAFPPPPSLATPLDGIYTRVVPREAVGGKGRCRRCPPYRLEVGLESLSLRGGVFRVSHQGTGYLATGHYTVDAEGITFFNDPNCPTASGVFAWDLEGETLGLSLTEDACAFANLRARYLTALPWTKMSSVLDGTYRGGETPNVLRLSRGRYVFASGRRVTMGDYAIIGNRLVLFNQESAHPVFRHLCQPSSNYRYTAGGWQRLRPAFSPSELQGIYTWSLAGRRLHLSVVTDPCDRTRRIILTTWTWVKQAEGPLGAALEP